MSPQPTLILQRLTPWPRRALIGEIKEPITGVTGLGFGVVCYSLEDPLILEPATTDVQRFYTGAAATGVVFQKIPYLTAIPAGDYRCKTAWSNRFRRRVAYLLNVPQFTEIIFGHGGNTILDTEGCVLAGMQKDSQSALKIWDCAPAVERVFAIIETAESVGECWVSIRNPVPASE